MVSGYGKYFEPGGGGAVLPNMGYKPPDRVWFHPGRGGGYSFIWPIWGCAALKGIVF